VRATSRSAASAWGCARHVEVQASVRPVNFVTPLTREIQTARGVGPAAAVGRSSEEMRSCVEAWIGRKFHHPRKKAIRGALVPEVSWSLELVLHEVKHEDEVDLLREHVTVHRLRDVVAALEKTTGVVPAAAGADFVDLIELGAPRP